jgi:hypothetical protein
MTLALRLDVWEGVQNELRAIPQATEIDAPRTPW